MGDLDKYNQITRNIASAKIFCDVLNVLSRHGLLENIKSSSIGHLITELNERLEILKKLHEETYDELGGIIINTDPPPSLPDFGNSDYLIEERIEKFQLNVPNQRCH